MDYTTTTVSTPVPTAVPDGNIPVGQGLRIQPNPVVAAAEIRFDLERESKVELGIYDLQGRRVANLLEGTLHPGPNVLRWDGRNSTGARVAAGIYLVRLVRGEELVVRRIIVVR
jgi:flagellar hook assembly protein FlgD